MKYFAFALLAISVATLAGELIAGADFPDSLVDLALFVVQMCQNLLLGLIFMIIVMWEDTIWHDHTTVRLPLYPKR
jgi:hypothetical protein